VSDANSHYEVHGCQSSSWTVQRVCDDKKTAIENASSLFKELSLKAVKVLEVSYGAEDEGFKDKEVHFEGERIAENKGAPSVPLIRPICRQAADLYRLDARRVIANQLKSPLAGWNIVPLELLYHAENLQRLNDTGQILQGAVQKVAISQIQKTGQKVNERVLDLYKLTNEILKELKFQRQQDDFIEMQNEDLDSLYAKASETDNPDRAFMTAFCRFMRPIQKLDEKFKKILELINANQNSPALKYLDWFFADFLNASENIKTVFGDSENLGDGLLRILDVIKGQAKPAEDCHEIFPVVIALIKRKSMPETQKSLVHKFKTTIEGNASFVKNDPFKSVMYHKRILENMVLKDGAHIGGQECVDALKERCARMTGSTSIAEFLYGYDNPLDRVDRLSDIASGIIGASNMRTIANYIIPVLESPFNIGQIFDGSRDDIKTLKQISTLQSKVRRAGFQDFFADRMAKNLDQIGIQLYEKKQVEDQLVNSSGDQLQLGLKLLRFVSEGAFSEPAVNDRTRALAKSTIMSKGFMLSLQEQAQTGGASANVLKEFTTLLQQTRIDR